MPKIPKNNLKERMLKLNYNPNLVKITPPVINYVPPPPPQQQPQQSASTYQYQPQQPEVKFEAPTHVQNLEEWSDFEEEY